MADVQDNSTFVRESQQKYRIMWVCMYHTPKGAPWPVGKYMFIRRRTHTAAKYRDFESEIKQNLSNELNTDCIYVYIKYKYNTSCTPLKKY